MKAYPVQLTSDEKRQLAKFVTMSSGEQKDVMALAKLEPQVSGPLLYAYMLVRALFG